MIVSDSQDRGDVARVCVVLGRDRPDSTVVINSSGGIMGSPPEARSGTMKGEKFSAAAASSKNDDIVVGGESNEIDRDDFP